LSRAEAAVEMAQHYEDARQLGFLLRQWSLTLKSPILDSAAASQSSS
jgi:hypothetical protein